METFDHTYTPEGSETPVTIQVPIPDGMLTAEAVAKDFMPKTGFQSELSRRTASILINKRDDAEYKTDLLAHWGIDPDATPPAEGDLPSIDERLTAERKTWDQTVLDPVNVKLDAANVTISELLSSSLSAEILQAAAGVKEAFRTRPRPDSPPAIVSTVAPVFEYDQEHRQFFVRDGDSFAFTQEPKEGKPPYMGVTEYMDGFLGRPENKDLLDDRRQRGPGIGDADQVKEGEAAFTITRTEAQNPALYRTAKAAAVKAGHAMPVVVDD